MTGLGAAGSHVVTLRITSLRTELTEADLREWQRNPELGDVFLEEFLSKSVGRVCVEGRGNRGI